MLCRSCGQWIPDNVTFCNYCGSQVVPANPTVPQAPLPTPSSPQQAWQSTPPPTPQQPWSSTPPTPRRLRDFAQPSSQQSGASWEHGIQQTTGNPTNLPATHPTNSGPTLPYGTNPSWQDHQPGQAAVPEYLSPQTVSSPLSQQPPWSQPFQPSQQEPSWSQPFPPAQPSQQQPAWSQPFPQDQLRTQASTGGSSPTPNRVQHLLIQLFQPSLAANPWLGIIIGGISPALLAALFFIMLSAMQHSSSSSASDLNALASSLTGVIPTDSAVRDGLQALLTAQGVSRHIVGSYSATAGNILLNVDLASPLQIMLLVPALFLVMGGYLAACTDMQNRTVASLWRGAAISLPYMLLLLLLSTQAKGDIASSLLPHTSSNSALSLLQGQVSFTLSMNVEPLIILSLFWGTLFGLLGASLKLARGHWRSWLHNFLRNNAQSRLTAIVAGGLVAVLLGFLFSLLLTYVAMVSNLQLMQGSSCGSGAASVAGSSLTTSNMAAGPFIAVQLFAFSFGTPISLNVHASGMSAITNALSNSSCLQQTSFSLFGGMAHSSPWLYLLLFLPAIALFAGGRVCTHFGRPASAGIAAIQGALIAIPFTIVMMILAALSMFSLSLDITGTVIILGNIPDTQIVVSLGATVIDVMVWSLLIGAFLGALGGIYQASAMSRELDSALARLGRGLTPLAGPAYKLIDQLDTRRPATRMRGRTLNILGAALLVTLLLTLLCVASGIFLISFSSVVTYDLNHRLHSIMNALLIALPGLFLLCTLISALFDDPQDAPETRGMNRMNLR